MVQHPLSLKQKTHKAHKEKAYDEAVMLYAQYLKDEPNDALMWSNLGVLHRLQQRPLQALRAQEKAFALAPHKTSVQNNYSNILSDLGKYEESIGLRRQILEKNPDDSSQLSMVGRCLRGLGENDAAIEYLKEACQRFPDDAEMELQLSFSQLSAGYYQDGFKSYKARWRTKHLLERQLSFPEWSGENLDGKTIVILPEQGFGDAIIVARFIPYFQARGAKVICYVKKPLRRLFENIEGVDGFVSDLNDVKDSDYWVNNIDLAQQYFQTNSQVPRPIELTVPQDSIVRARELTQKYAGRFKVGVVWNGSVTYKNNAYRSFDHTQLLTLCDVDNVQLFSLYKGPALKEYEADGSSAFMINACGQDRDFADCAAVMREMDLVITSDTVTAHLAGSLGVPVWTILHWDPFWLWQHSGETTQWYPSIRLFRQDIPLDWSGVIERVKQALIDEMKG